MGLLANMGTAEAQSNKPPKGYQLVEYSDETFEVYSCTKKGNLVIIFYDAQQKQVLQANATYFRNGFLVKSQASCPTKDSAREIVSVFQKITSGIER